jgi:hypothetical protein
VDVVNDHLADSFATTRLLQESSPMLRPLVAATSSSSSPQRPVQSSSEIIVFDPIKVELLQASSCDLLIQVNTACIEA